tara:strand:- start:209 stop:1087 length:879 start_codon:yes stop_codon:yes gene_type:complete
MYGLVWLNATEEMDFSLFKNYKNGLQNYIGSEVNLVSNVNEIQDKQLVFVIDEHFVPHREFIFSKEFIQKLNTNKTKIIILNTEKILNQPFKHNLQIYKDISKFENRLHILSDANDIRKLGSPFANKQLLSRSFEFNFKKYDKKNSLLFIGQVDGRAYENRRKILNKIEKFIDIPLEVENTKRKLKYQNFLQKMSEYKYILNPLGNGTSEFLNVRYYEILYVNSIPVQQFTKRMLDNYEELHSAISINFNRLKDLKKISFKNEVNLSDYKNLSSPYLEDYLHEVGFRDLINK